MQRRNQVVMFFASLVVEQDALLQSLVNNFVGDLAVLAGERGRNFQDVVRTAGIAAGVGRNFGQHLVGCVEFHFS